MAQVPTGTLFSVATAFAADKTVTAISNAATAVVSCTAHGYSNGDIVEITSGWGKLNKRAFRVAAVSADTFQLEGQDTTNTSFYPTGSSAGTVRKVTTWQQFEKIMNPQSNGGDPKTVNYKYIESDVEYSINDGFSATSYTLELDADAIGGAGYNALKSLTEVQTDTIMRMQLRSGSPIYLPCKVALNENVKLTDGQINRVTVAFNGNNRATRYAA
jgi:hypothetical protein